MEQPKQPTNKSIRANKNCGPSLFIDEPIDAGLSENADEEEGIWLNSPSAPETAEEDESEQTTLNTSGVQEGHNWREDDETRGKPALNSA